VGHCLRDLGDHRLRPFHQYFPDVAHGVCSCCAQLLCLGFNPLGLQELLLLDRWPLGTVHLVMATMTHSRTWACSSVTDSSESPPLLGSSQARVKF
jgi:hypothetical protein